MMSSSIPSNGENVADFKIFGDLMLYFASTVQKFIKRDVFT